MLVHLNHHLAQMALRLLRAEVWNQPERPQLFRVTARLIPDAISRELLVLVYTRLVVIGANSTRLHEEFLTAGGEILQGGFRRLNVGQVQAALGALRGRADELPAEPGRVRPSGLWSQIEAPLQRALEARMEERAASLQRLLDEREAQEKADITAILGKLETAIRRELDEPEYVQLELFTSSEREQYSRNVAALETRLAQIPGELEPELAQIRARYANVQVRLFPVAVVFLVPERLQ